MSFVKFTETARSYRPRASLRSNGTIGFNTGAVEKFGLKTSNYVTLHFDKDRGLIGVRAGKAEDEGAHKLNRGKTGAWIGARRFLDYFGIAPAETKKFDAQWDEKEKMIVFRSS